MGNLSKNIVWTSIGRISSQMVSILVSIILARIIDPDSFGLISMVTIYISFADYFLLYGFPNALIQKKDADSVDFSSVFYFTFVFSLFFYFVLYFVAPYISLHYELPQLTMVMRIIGIRVIISAINSVQQAYISKKMEFKKLLIATVISSFVSGIVGLIAAYSGLGVWAIVIQQLTSAAVSTFVLWIIVDWRPTYQFSFSRLKELLSFSWKILAESLSANLENQLRNLLVGDVYSSSQLAYFTKAQLFPNIINDNITSSIGTVLFPEMSNNQNDFLTVKSVLRKSIRISSYIVFPMLTGLAVVAYPLTLFVLTEKWIKCVPFIQMFCIIGIFKSCMVPRHQALNSIGLSNVYLYENLIGRVIAILLLLVLYKKSVTAIAVSAVLGTFINLCVVMYTSSRFNQYSLREQVKDIIVPMLLCGLMGGAGALISKLEIPILILFVLQIVCCAALYMMFSALLKPEGYVYLIDIVKGYIHTKRKRG